MEDSTNYCCQKQRHNFLKVLRFGVNMFYCGKVCNDGISAWNGSRFEHICVFYVEINKQSRGEKENVMLWPILRPICRGAVSQCTRACANSTSNPPAYRPRDSTSCFARVLVRWDYKPLQNRSESLKYRHCIFSYIRVYCPRPSVIGRRPCKERRGPFCGFMLQWVISKISRNNGV